MQKEYMQKKYVSLDKLKTLNIDGNVIEHVKVRGENTENMPMWIVNHYLKSTCDNYIKLVYLLKIIGLYSEEKVEVEDIGISVKSIPVSDDGIDFENKLLENIYTSEEKKKEKSYRWISEDPQEFKHYLYNCERPVCFVRMKNEEVILLHDPRGSEGIKISDISFHSPINACMNGIFGAVDHLINIRNSIRNDERMQDEHTGRMINQSLQNMQASINVLEKLNDSNLPGSYKIVFSDYYNHLMGKQETLNKKLGITCQGFDQYI